MSTSPLLEMIGRRGGDHERRTALPRLVLHRATRPTDAVAQCPKPTLCIVLQGEKRAYVGDQSFLYDADRFLVSLVEMPIASAVRTASPAEPYLGFALELDLVEMAALALEMGVGAEPQARGVVGAPLTADLVEALTRYVGLLDRPDDIRFLATGMEREIWYRLLCGPAGGALSQLSRENGVLARIGRATRFLRGRYAEQTSIADLVAASGMSRTTFHEAFHQATGTSPLHYQKLVRLQEARRLLGAGRRTAAQAAFEVGYASPSHFNRDYRKAFGATPLADARSLRRSPDRPIDA